MLYLVLLFLLIALVLRIDFVFYIVYVCLGIYGWSRWKTNHTLKNLRAERVYADHAFLGEEATISIELHNLSWLPVPWIGLGESIPLELRASPPVGLATHLKGKESKQFHYQVRAFKRGYYQLGPLSIQFGDLFGFSEQRANVPPTYFTVYPNIIPLHRLPLFSRLPFGTIASKQRLFADPARPMGVRPFRSGDSLRQINWKVSAHTQDFLVKTLEPAISLETMILLNLNVADYKQGNYLESSEWGIELAASLAAHLVQQRQPVGLITNGADPLQARLKDGDESLFDSKTGRLMLEMPASPLPAAWDLGHPLGRAAAFVPPKMPAGSGRPHLMKLLELLARIEADETIHFPTWTTRACLGLSWGTTILVITPSGDQETCQACHRLARSGYNPTLLLIEPQPDSGTIRKRARSLGFSAYPLHRPANLSQWQQLTQP